MRKVSTLTISGAIDLHVHFRQPSDNKSETIASGSKAALMGGFVAVCDMPNNPGRPVWSFKAAEAKQAIIKKEAYIPIGTYAGAQPESDNIDELERLAQVSIGLKSYATKTTGNDREYGAVDFRPIHEQWHKVAPDKPIMLHSGEDNLEEFINSVAKDLNHHLHVCHVNNARDVKLVSRAKKQGLPVSCGVCPHHLFKTSHDEVSEGWFSRMMPPLARQDEAEELFKLLSRGEIDVVESDHAPHSLQAKMKAETEEGECFGVPGVEFMVPLLLYQMTKGRISQQRLVDATSTKPAQILGIKLSAQTKVTWDMQTYRIGHETPRGLSGSHWTPYMDKLATGKVKKITLGGQTLINNGKIIKKLPRFISSRGEVI